MDWLRKHWFDLGLPLAIITSALLLIYGSQLTDLRLALWVSLITLWLHQLEEYRFPGYFPGMINRVMFKSEEPDRYPLNTNTALVVNVYIGWLLYLLAALVAENAVWLAMAAVLVSFSNFIVHTFVFNVKGRTIYNPGMVTGIVLFLPLTGYFFYLLYHQHLATPWDYVIGIPLGAALSYVGTLKTIEWLKAENTPFVFPPRSVRPGRHPLIPHEIEAE